MVCLTTPGALQGPTDAVMIDWKSTRTPRVVRSTMAGEAYAADDAIDRGVYVNQCLCELIFGAKASPLSNPQYLRHLHATDCKSLFDAIIASNFQTEENLGNHSASKTEAISPRTLFFAFRSPNHFFEAIWCFHACRCVNFHVFHAPGCEFSRFHVFHGPGCEFSRFS